MSDSKYSLDYVPLYTNALIAYLKCFFIEEGAYKGKSPMSSQKS